MKQPLPFRDRTGAEAVETQPELPVPPPSLEALQREFQDIVSCGIAPIAEAQYRFAERLLECGEADIVGFHFGLLQSCDDPLLLGALRSAFARRGADGEAFLLKKLKREKDPGALAGMLHILGAMYSPHARYLAMDLLQNPHQGLRRVATYVLGWVGIGEDVDLLERSLLQDVDPGIRSLATTAYRQLFERFPEVQVQAAQNLQAALRHEQDEEVLTRIMLALQSILNKRFGLREDIQEGTVIGNLKEATDKAWAFFEKYPDLHKILWS